MRLTLRTLLAFMDDILDPIERDQLTNKITQSDYAKGLMERVGQLMRNAHMSAPIPGASNQKIDANHVACYLDNTLAPEQVSSVEKICLESDLHLAETAACHQVLAQVLSETVEIPSETRQRIYELIPGDSEQKKDSQNLIIKEGPETIAGFFAEPVQGAGGVIPPSKDYFALIQPILKKYKLSLIHI